MKKEDFKLVPLAELTTPKPGLMCMAPAWWVMTEDNCVLFYTARRSNSPQCNTDKRVTDMMLERYEKLGFGPLRSEFVQMAFRRRED